MDKAPTSKELQNAELTIPNNIYCHVINTVTLSIYQRVLL